MYDVQEVITLNPEVKDTDWGPSFGELIFLHEQVL